MEKKSKLWTGLKERPASDDPGWFVEGTGFAHHKAWRDADGVVQWRDYPNQAKGRPGIDFFWIAAGVQDLYPDPTEEFPHGGPWNSLWTGADHMNEASDPIGLERIKAYAGNRPRTPISMWPEQYKKAWLETHDSDYGR